MKVLKKQNFKKLDVDEAIVLTTGGLLKGVHIKSSQYDYLSFKGIPYAEPPVGDLRFRSPIPHKGWKGVRDASEHGSFCANKFGFFGVEGTVGGSEDCLFLNVYTPDLKRSHAVMFWIHGGAFMSGNGNSLLYGPGPLVSENVVLVTINHRYSAFGFLSTNDEFAPGNQGLKDIVLALTWVQQNINQFGGDPDRVTVFGHSAGSTAVHFLMLSDMTEGLFQQSIMQSGAAFSPCLFQPNSTASAEGLGRKLGLKFSSTKELVEELRKVDVKAIVEAETPLFQMPAPFALTSFEFVPSSEPKSSSEATFLSEAPIEKMKSGKFRKMPMMVGSPDTEGMFVALLLQNHGVLEFYNKNFDFLVPLSFGVDRRTSPTNMSRAVEMLKKLYFDEKLKIELEDWLNVFSDFIFRQPSDRAVKFYAEAEAHPIFVYEFRFDGSLNFFKKLLKLEKFKGTCHADELFYLFDTELPKFVADKESGLMKQRMTRMWANFAKFG